MTTPTLPPLPPKMVLRRVMPDDYRYGDVYGYTEGQMQAYASAAYQTGRYAGLEEAIQACMRVGRPVGCGDGDTYIPGTSADAAHAIEALKSSIVGGGQIDQKSPARPVNAESRAVTMTGRDLYNSQRGYPLSPEWCTLSDEDQADWDRKAKEQA